jgi:ankyrin repeat protein
VAVVELLLAAGADPNCGCPMSLAKCPLIARRLLDAGARPCSLHSVSCGAIAKMLIDAGADVMQRGRWDGKTPLHKTRAYHCPEVVRQLLNAGADPNALDNMRRTPLHEAVDDAMVEGLDASRADIIKMLLEAGADPLAKDRDGLSVLARICTRKSVGQKCVVYEIVDPRAAARA